MIPDSSVRVPQHTAEHVNARIAGEAGERVARLAMASPAVIDRRLDELDAEWDVERVLEANASTLALAGVVLGATVDKRWLFLPGAVTVFLLQHAVQGWRPPVTVLRRLGVRTVAEIDRERYALKALRGHFRGLPQAPTSPAARQAFAAAAQG
ncbi:hypothetical protein [Alienimonas californiensis]|uniref:Uncharacterized protein n=1 Tax=Alienimonas californiensis TaxID=2527989 RepID=A0A517P6G3_9PLAN|nr:hypothetical protein [Alienimonas californiensis]QDT14965.1 hypothetical protein CA12_10450 [Alienimonas californiensis]